MSISTKAIIIGDIHFEQIAEKLEALFDIGKVEIDTRAYESDGYVRCFFPDPDPSHETRRQLYIFKNGSTQDDMDIFDGPRTSLSLGASGSSVQIMTALAEIYGGYVLAPDTNTNWVLIEGDSEIANDRSPETQLKIELASILPAKEALLLSRVANDPDKMQAVIDAYARCQDRMSAEPSMSAPSDGSFKL